MLYSNVSVSYNGFMARLARKKQTKKPTQLPKDFLLSVGKLFNEQFKKERRDAEFLIYGDLYMNEVLFCASLTHPKSLAAASFYLSMDLTKDVSEKPELVTEKLKVMVDIAASWFAQSFGSGGGLEAVLNALKDSPVTWEEFTWEKETLFVKINKDNHALENVADKLLKDAGITDEELEEMEMLEEDEDIPHKLN